MDGGNTASLNMPGMKVWLSRTAGELQRISTAEPMLVRSRTMFNRHLKVWPKRLPHHLTLPETSVYYNLEVSAHRYPNKTAIVYYDRPMSYRQFKEEVDALAGYLQTALGVRKGDRVLLYMQNSPQFIIGYYAILRADAVVVPVNPMNLTEELGHYAEDTGSAVAIASQDLYRHIQPLLGRATLRHVVVAAYSDYVAEDTSLILPEEVAEPRQALRGEGVVLWREAITAECQPGPHTAGPDDYCVFPYSSGTTGPPKGCMHTHRNAMATLIGGVIWNPTTQDSVSLTCLPLFHVTGMQNAMNGPIYLGATMVVMTRWERRTAAELIRRYQVTHWRSIATMVIDFLSDPEIKKEDLASLMAVGGGGASMPQAIEQRLYELTGLRYIEGYGLSEALAATHINPPEQPKAQCLGIPVFDVDARVVDLETDKELGPNEVGEIVIRGPQVFKGYWNNPEAISAAFMELDGERFFRTGDMGYYDEEGYFFLVDRVKRMINASGFKVWPAEVESLMYKHPAIQEVCVIAVSDPRRGETAKAVIVLKEGYQGKTGEQDIIDWCREHMAAYKVPRLIAFADSLPKSASGKVLWRVLQEQERTAS